MCKKVVCVLISAVLLMCCSVCLASDFELRSGIRFGDTMEDILAKEKTLVRESDNSNWFNGKIAGYEDAQCGFYFDDDTHKMYAMDYSFHGKVCTSRDSMDNVYKTLYQSLKRKYGTPLGNTGGSCHIITGPAIDSQMSLWVYMMPMILSNFDGDYTDYDEWIVECGEYKVKIDLVSFYYLSATDSKYTYNVDLSYKYFTDEDVQKAIDEKKQSQSEVDNDL